MRDYVREYNYLLGLATKVVDDINKRYKKNKEGYSRDKFITKRELDRMVFMFKEDVRYRSIEYNQTLHMIKPAIEIDIKYLENNTLDVDTKSEKQIQLNEEIEKVLIHELVRYWCRSWLDYDEMINASEGSPFFTTLVDYLGGKNIYNFDSFNEVRHTKFYKDIMQYDSLEDVEITMFDTVSRLADITRKYPNLKFIWQSAEINTCSNLFEMEFGLDDIPKFIKPHGYKFPCEEDDYRVILPRDISDLNELSKDISYLAIELIIDNKIGMGDE